MPEDALKACLVSIGIAAAVAWFMPPYAFAMRVIVMGNLALASALSVVLLRNLLSEAKKGKEPDPSSEKLS